MSHEIKNVCSNNDSITVIQINLDYKSNQIQKERQTKIGLKTTTILFFLVLLLDITTATHLHKCCGTAFVSDDFAKSTTPIGINNRSLRSNKLTCNLNLLCSLPKQTSTFLSSNLNDDEDDIFNEEEPPPSPITREKFYREMLAHPIDDEETQLESEAVVFRRKSKKNGRKQSFYKPVDNRDNLPFIVKDCTPDPYTKPGIIEREAKKNTQIHKKKKKEENKVESKKKSKKKSVRTNLYGLGIESGIAASVYKRKDDGSLDKILGQFQLDKSTNCGDLLEIGVGENNKEYEVLRAKCQYKYAGGKKFVMVRKILEVKEITRLAEENYLARQLRNTPDLPK